MESKNNYPADSQEVMSAMDDGAISPCMIPSPSGRSSAEYTMDVSDEEPKCATASKRNCDKYNLRRSSLRVRVQTEEKKQQPKQKKPKCRPPPLSKYRRRSANARERFRMAEINDAFEELKHVLPQEDLEAQQKRANDLEAQQLAKDSNSSSSGRPAAATKGNRCGTGSNSSRCNKNQPTKITVLRLAINYIAGLRDILGYNPDGSCSSSSGSSSNGRYAGSGGDHVDSLSDDLGSDAASSATPSTSSGSGDEESLLSSDMDTAGVSDLDFFASSLTADFSPDLSPDFTATLSPEEEMCLELVASVL